MELIRKETGKKIPVLKKGIVETGKVVPYLSFPGIDACSFVEHLFTTREGGVSTGIYASANLGFSRGDEHTCVMENFQRFATIMHTDLEHIVISDQTHTTNVRVVTEADLGKGILRPKDYADIDGLITNVPGICLVTYYADCVPLFFADPVKRAIGLSHSGWRGTVAGMGEVTIQKMIQEFGTDPSRLHVAIGPSICQDCYEVSEDVAQAFGEAFSGKEQLVLKKGRMTEDGEQKWQLNLWEANRQIFLRAGVLEEHIEITDICTKCNSRYLFSHRATQGKRGTLAAFMKIK